MTKDPSKDFKEWSQRGADDLAFAKDAFRESEYFAHVCALCHQAVEKYLKAYIVKTRGEIRKQDQTHKLIYLAKLCQKEGLDLLKDYEEDLRLLYAAYIPARYPLPMSKAFNKEDAKKLLKVAEEIIEKIQEKL